MVIVKQVCVSLHSDRNIAAGCVRISHAAASVSHAHAGLTSPRPLLPPLDINHARQTDNHFSVRGVFRRHGTYGPTDKRTADPCIPQSAIDAASGNNNCYNKFILKCDLLFGNRK